MVNCANWENIFDFSKSEFIVQICVQHVFNTDCLNGAEVEKVN